MGMSSFISRTTKARECPYVILLRCERRAGAQLWADIAENVWAGGEERTAGFEAAGQERAEVRVMGSKSAHMKAETEDT